jgi:hypothetical protein
MLRSNGLIHDSVPRTIAALHTLPQDCQPDCHLGQALTLSAISTSTKRTYHISPELLVRRWGIGLAQAKQTVQVTTQRGVRSILNPTLARRFRTNDRQLRYRRLPCKMFTDTLEANVMSWHRQNKYTQVFSTRLDHVL